MCSERRLNGVLIERLHVSGDIYKAVKVYFLEKHSKIFAETDQNCQHYKNEDYIAEWYETVGTKQHNGYFMMSNNACNNCQISVN